MTRQRRGVTLAELLVTLVVLSAITSLTTLGVRRIEHPSPNDPTTIASESLRVAIDQGRTISFSVESLGGVGNATVYPDGSVIADSAFHIDALTGRPANAR